MIEEAGSPIDEHYASQTSQRRHEAFPQGRPSNDPPRPTGLNLGEQTLTDAFFSSRVGNCYLDIAITEMITLQIPVVNILTTK